MLDRVVPAKLAHVQPEGVGKRVSRAQPSASEKLIDERPAAEIALVGLQKRVVGSHFGKLVRAGADRF